MLLNPLNYQISSQLSLFLNYRKRKFMYFCFIFFSLLCCRFIVLHYSKCYLFEIQMLLHFNFIQFNSQKNRKRDEKKVEWKFSFKSFFPIFLLRIQHEAIDIAQFQFRILIFSRIFFFKFSSSSILSFFVRSVCVANYLCILYLTKSSQKPFPLNEIANICSWMNCYCSRVHFRILRK